ncbi:hypothetical protein AcW2_005833 [Taiwanofungus camphoratus]|nr:hypothetical protein AcW2_005833 [Antrodia cinnamomea]
MAKEQVGVGIMVNMVDVGNIFIKVVGSGNDLMVIVGVGDTESYFPRKQLLIALGFGRKQGGLEFPLFLYRFQFVFARLFAPLVFPLSSFDIQTGTKEQ